MKANEHVKIFLTNLIWGILFSASWYTCLEVLKLSWTITWIVNLTLGWIELEGVYLYGKYRQYCENNRLT